MDKTTFNIIIWSIALVFLVLYMMRRSARRKKMLDE